MGRAQPTLRVEKIQPIFDIKKVQPTVLIIENFQPTFTIGKI
jgi:hypothetical protein